jgi:hypothetical protein
MILILPQFAQKEFFAIALDCVAFWAIFVLILSKKWREILAKNSQINDIFLNEFFLPRSVISWFYFLLLFALSLIVSLSDNYNAGWIFSAVIFVLMLSFYQELHEKFSSDKKMSRLSACALFLVLSYVVGLHLASISDIFNYNLKSLKSPNHVNDQMVKIIKNHTKKDEQIMVIASTISGTYPIINYLEKENPLPSAHLLSFYESIEKNDSLTKAKSYLFSRLKQQLKNQNTKLIFIEKKQTAHDDDCRISFLEKYFYDQEFKEIFLKNYVFLNRIIEEIPAEKKVSFFNEEPGAEPPHPVRIIERDVEIYIRK